MLQSIINQDWGSFKTLLTVLAVLYARFRVCAD
jgi:hypothetical protein